MPLLSYAMPSAQNLLTFAGRGTKIVTAGKLAESAFNVMGTTNSIRSSRASKVAQGYKGVSRTKSKMKYKRKTQKGKKVATVAAVKRMIGQVVETKQLALGWTNLFPVADVNKAWAINLTAKITQGTADGNRVGDSILLKSLHIFWTCLTNTNATFYRYRLIIGWSGEEYNTTNFSTSNLTVPEILVSSGPAEACSGIVNTKAFTAIYDAFVDVNSQIDTIAEGRTIRINLNLKGLKFNYQSAGSVYGKTKNLYAVIIPNYQGAAPSTNQGSHIFNAVIKYADA